MSNTETNPKPKPEAKAAQSSRGSRTSMSPSPDSIRRKPFQFAGDPLHGLYAAAQLAIMVKRYDSVSAKLAEVAGAHGTANPANPASLACPVCCQQFLQRQSTQRFCTKAHKNYYWNRIKEGMCQI